MYQQPGGDGAEKRSITAYISGTILNGEKGINGTDSTPRATGGGGSGGIGSWRSILYNAAGGATGTSYSGGAGGGGVYRWTDWNQAYPDGTYANSNAKPNGGAGGQGFAMQTQHTNAYSNGGGSGAGTTAQPSNPVTGTRGRMYENTPGELGTGGLLILYSDILYNEGEITSDGSKGGTATGNGGCGSGGAGSGAGSINIFARYVKAEGTTSTKGGAKGIGSAAQGGEGGDGSYTVNELGSRLNYPEKKITLNINNTYTIDQTKLTYTKLNEIQTQDIIVRKYNIWTNR